MSDRTVHAAGRGVEIVRYDRSGKWYKEIPGLPRVKLTVEEAAQQATLPWFVWHPNLPGGRRFDALVRKRKATG